jgi:hypothetical protein
MPGAIMAGTKPARITAAPVIFGAPGIPLPGAQAQLRGIRNLALRSRARSSGRRPNAENGLRSAFPAKM